MLNFPRSITLAEFGLLLGCLQPTLILAVEKPDTFRETLWVYVGTYTRTPEAGINFCQFDPASGRLTDPKVVARVPNPSFIALHPRRPFLYAISEISDFAGKEGGSVTAYRIEPNTGHLTLLNQQSSGGPGPCYISVDRTGKVALVANYGGGSVACLPIQPDGSLKPAACIDLHRGSSVNPSRQAGPFAHCIDVDPANRFALSADLGIDKLLIYRLNAAEGTFSANSPAFASSARGAGPRHLAFHPNGRFVYVINELKSTIRVFRYDPGAGKLSPAQDITTLPHGFAGGNTTAEVQIHPSGRFLYGSNRGHNSIAIFAIDPESGMLRILGHQPTQGKSPRHFALDPSGRFLLAANQDSDNIIVFRVNPQSGMIQPGGASVNVSMPVCVVLTRPVS
jgi:6-phosphogluconolactonase